MIEKDNRRAFACVLVLKGGNTLADLEMCINALEMKSEGAIVMVPGFDGNDSALLIDADKCGLKPC